jgi:AMP-binding enzyme
MLSGIVADVAGRFTEHTPLRLLTMPSAQTLFPSLGAFKPSAQFEALPALDGRPDYATACIFHSSGSTAWPKPIHITERSALASFCAWLCSTDEGSYSNSPDKRVCAMALPLFHILGFYSAIALPFVTGTKILLSRPAIQSEGTGIQVVTADTVLAAASEVPCNALIIAPSMLTVRLQLCLRICVKVYNADSTLTWPYRKPGATLQRSKYLHRWTLSLSVAVHSTKKLATSWFPMASMSSLYTDRQSELA